MDSSEPARAVFRSSGKVNWLKFLPAFLGTAGVAAGMAGCLFFAYLHGFYLIFVAPIIAAGVVAVPWYVALTWSNCRNRPVAAVAAVVLGLLVYLGYFYCDMIRAIGVDNARRIDLLPDFVHFRMMTDVTQDVHDVARPAAAQAAPRQPGVVQQVFNWVFFVGELLVVCGVLVGIGLASASRTYCEACGRWMKSETLVFAPGIGASLWQNLQRGQFADVEAAGRTGTSRPDVIGCRLTVEHCPSCPAENGPPAVYLTLKDLAEAGTAPGVGFAKSRNIARLHTLVDHVALRPQEIGALAGAFPSLRTSIEAQPHLYAEVQSAVRQLRRERQAVLSEWQKPLAQVEPVEPGEAGRILKGNNILKQTVIGIGSGLGGFALALGVPAIFMSMNPKPPDWVAIVAIVWMFGWMILNLLWVMFYGNYLTARFMLRQTQRAFARRAEVAVNMNNPDLWFVDIIPPKNWGKMTLENATDIGFLELDKSRRELIFEGDRERYWIPVESILEVKHEFWSEPVQHHFQSKPTQHHLTVVRAMTPDGPWETWFYRRQVRFRMRTAKRRLADAQELEEKIQALMEPAT